jgi:hypothetical protein
LVLDFVRAATPRMQFPISSFHGPIIGDSLMSRLFALPAVTVAALTFATLTLNLTLAQAQLPEPPIGLKPPPPPPPPEIKPYAPVPITLPAPLNDPSFVAFRKTLSDVAQRKDRAALANLIVTNGFFWLQDKDVADPSKSGIDNFAKAIDLDSKAGTGWEIVADDAAEPTAAESSQKKGLFCAPAPPRFDMKAFGNLLQATGTESDIAEWGYPAGDGVEVRAEAKPNAQVLGKMGLYFVRVLPETAPTDNVGPQSFLHVVLPNGKTGYVPVTAIAPLITDQICYLKDANSWKIAGYIGGAQP